jgi:hypothetical protein
LNTSAAANSAATISPAARPAPMATPNATQFSPLHDAVVNLHPIADDRTGTAMSDIDPMKIGRAMVDDQQPPMTELPGGNALPKGRFEAADYVPADAPGGKKNPANQRMNDPSVQQADFAQTAAGDAARVQTIDPLEVARSLDATPAPPSRATGF